MISVWHKIHDENREVYRMNISKAEYKKSPEAVRLRGSSLLCDPLRVIGQKALVANSTNQDT